MSLDSESVSKIIELLGNKFLTVTKKIQVLKCICSEFTKLVFNKTINRDQLRDLIRLLFRLINEEDENENENTRELQKSYEECLQMLANKFHVYINFFQNLLKVERRKRVKIMVILNKLDLKSKGKIAKDLSIVSYLNDCLKTINKNQMSWLGLPAMTIETLIETESKMDPTDESLIIEHLKFLTDLYNYSLETPSFDIERFHMIVLEKVILLGYMGYKKQRSIALELIGKAMETDFPSYIKNMHTNLWSEYKLTLRKNYCPRMTTLILAGDSDWSTQWKVSIEILETDLFSEKSELINSLLSVEEKAFKSSDMNVRRTAFEVWKTIIDGFALNVGEFTLPRRIKLLTMPLIAKNSKTEVITLRKLEVWWHLLAKLLSSGNSFTSEQNKSLNQVIRQFLNFCFGPLGDTPLLSIISDVAESSGKKYNSTRLCGVDALLQLLVINYKQHKGELISSLEERISHSIPIWIFQECYKSILHSVGEALLIIKNFERKDVKDPMKVCHLLWSNLIAYIDESKNKITIYRELLKVTEEVLNHFHDPEFVDEFVLKSVITELVKSTELIQFKDETLMQFLIKCFPTVMRCGESKYHHYMVKIIVFCIKPDTAPNVYHKETLSLIQLLMHSLQSCLNDNPNANQFFVYLIWCTVAEHLTKFIELDGRINEGSDEVPTFDTVHSFLTFPFFNTFCNKKEGLFNVSKLWKELFKKFDARLGRIGNVDPNEIVNNLTSVMGLTMDQNKSCHVIISHCLDTIVSSFNYDKILSKKKIPPIMDIIRKVISANLSGHMPIEIVLSLKSFDALVLTIFGQNQEKALEYLLYMKRVVDQVLNLDFINEIVEQKIVDTWQTICKIIKNSVGSWTLKFLSKYEDTFLLSMKHENEDISNQTSLLFSMESGLDEDCQILFEKLNKEGQKIVDEKKVDKPTRGEETVKKVKHNILKRNTPSPKTVKPVELKKRDGTKSPLVLDSQEFVMIPNNNLPFNPDLLTEHQKESLKRRRDDIPALYNDLSRSESRDTQDLVEWFKNEKEPETPDANKENKEDKSDKEDATEVKDPQVEDTNLPEGDNHAPAVRYVAKKLNYEDLFSDTDSVSSFTKRAKKKSFKTSSLPADINLRTLRSRSLVNSPQKAEEKREGLKRKAESIDTAVDSIGVKRRRRHQASVESDSQLTDLDDTVSERTRKEMSRLKIDMTFDMRTPTKSRMKTNDYIYEIGKSGRGRKLKSSDESQEIISGGKRRKARDAGKKSKLESPKRSEDSSPESSPKDDDEVVQSSQELMRSPLSKKLHRNIEKRGLSPTTRNSALMSPAKVSVEGTMPDPKKLLDLFGDTPSVRGVKIPRSKFFMQQGRAAHMVGLATKMNEGKDEEKKGKDIEKIVSPTARKMISNLKSVSVILSSPPSKPFSGLRNYEEKMSNHSESEEESVEEKEKETEMLQMLGWSDYEPSSALTPSNSILKKAESEKKKRVSFSDPPVSRKMGYKVESNDEKKRGTPRMRMIKKGTPVTEKFTTKELKVFIDREMVCLDDAAGVDKSEEKNEETDEAEEQEDPLEIQPKEKMSPNSESGSESSQIGLLSQPELLDSDKPIFPDLVGSNESVSCILPELVAPLWIKNVKLDFKARNIKSVGDLARLSEREIARLSLKGNNKVELVKKVLNKFSEAQPSSSSKDEGRDEVVPMEVDGKGTEVQKEMKTAGVQAGVEEFLENLDEELLLQVAIKKCSSEKILQACNKKSINAKVEIPKGKVKIVGMPTKLTGLTTESVLYKVCGEFGLEKVLNVLPRIFPEHLYNKISEVYREKLKIVNKTDELENEICKLSSNKICALLSTVLKNEDKSDVNAQINEFTALNILLRRMKVDSIITYMVENDILNDISIPPSISLDMAIQSNQPEVVIQALKSQFPEFDVQQNLNQQNISAFIKENNFNEGELLEIMKAVASKVTAKKMMDLNYRIISELLPGN